MSEGKAERQWSHTSSLIHATVQVHSKRTLSPDDFNPYANRGKRKPDKVVSVTEWRDLCHGQGLKLEKRSLRSA